MPTYPITWSILSIRVGGRGRPAPAGRPPATTVLVRLVVDVDVVGVDHVLASGRDINILVLDTEVYSNTGGQTSKATPIGAVAKFSASGKPIKKKDLGMIAMSYGHVYVAQVSMGANMTQVAKAFAEAEAHPGSSLIIAYSHCIAHGIDMTTGMQLQKEAVNCGYWPLYRFNPALIEEGKNPLPPGLLFVHSCSPTGRSPLGVLFRDYGTGGGGGHGWSLGLGIMMLAGVVPWFHFP